MYTPKKYSWRKHIDFIFIDLLCLNLAFATAYRLKFDDFSFLDSQSWGTFLVIISLLDIGIAVFTCAYSGIVRCRSYEVFFRAVKLTFYNFLSACVVFYMLKLGANYSRVALFVMYIIYWFISSFAKAAWLRVIKMKRKNNLGLKKLLVIAGKEGIGEVLSDVQTGDFNTFDIRALYLYDNQENSINEVNGIPVLPLEDDYVQYVLRSNIEEIFIDSRYINVDKEQISRLIINGVKINVSIEGLFGVETDNQYINKVGVCKTISVGNFSFSSQQLAYQFFKRICDIVLGIIGCICMLPIMAFVKLAYVLTGDHAPIIYSQKRVGKDGKIIKMYKFRSMVCNADELLQDMLKEEKYRSEWEQDQKFLNDPRITRVGKFLRSTSIDEVPQFINVLKGELSLVGPRPLVEGELEAHGGLKLYNKVKPGITGWWACHGRSNISYKERLEMEYHYVRNCSLDLDILVLIRTAIGVIKKSGAV